MGPKRNQTDKAYMLSWAKKRNRVPGLQRGRGQFTAKWEKQVFGIRSLKSYLL